MPVVKKGGKYAIGSGRAMYDSKASAERAYAGYKASKGKKRSGNPCKPKASVKVVTGII